MVTLGSPQGPAPAQRVCPPQDNVVSGIFMLPQLGTMQLSWPLLLIAKRETVGFPFFNLQIY